MYSIVLTDGKIINIKATEVEWCEKTRMIKLINNRRIIARINMDNVVGWIDADYKAEEDDEEKPYNTDIENPAIKKWIFERAECNFINHDLWDFKLRCPNCFTVSTFSISPFAVNTFSEDSKCPVCDEPLIFDPEDMFKNEKTN